MPQSFEDVRPRTVFLRGTRSVSGRFGRCGRHVWQNGQISTECNENFCILQPAQVIPVYEFTMAASSQSLPVHIKCRK